MLIADRGAIRFPAPRTIFLAVDCGRGLVAEAVVAPAALAREPGILSMRSSPIGYGIVGAEAMMVAPVIPRHRFASRIESMQGARGRRVAVLLAAV